MKKLLLCSTLFFAVSSLFAQQFPTHPPTMTSEIQSGKVTTPMVLKSGNPEVCGMDTVKYPESKMTTAIGTTMNVPSEFSGYAQYFDGPQAMTVSGFRFYAGINSSNGDNAVIVCKIWTANADSTPGTILSEKNITIGETYNPADLPSMRYDVVFDSVANVTGAYLVSIETSSSFPIGIIIDDNNTADGQGENLMYWKWENDQTWYQSQDFFAWDVDFQAYPFVTYDYGVCGSASNDTICIGDSVVFCFDSASAIYYNRMYNQNIANSFMWDFGDGNNSTDSCATNIYSTQGAYTITLMNTLTGWTSNCSGTDTMSVIVDSPTVSFQTFNGPTICLGDTIQFINNSTYSSGLAYLWDFGDNTTDTAANPSHVYGAVGMYTITLTATGQNGCSTIDSIVDYVNVAALPVPSFTTSITTLPTVDFANTSTNSVSYTWDFAGLGTSNQANPSFTFPSDGNYMVCLTAVSAVGCVDSTCMNVSIIGTGITSNDLNQMIEVYPNPSNGVVTINRSFTESLNLEVLDITGKVIEAKTLVNPSSNLNLSYLSQGSYLLRFTLDGASTTKRLSIVR
jgi:PKD repeat protein